MAKSKRIEVLTFKTEKATGRYRSFESDYHIVNAGGLQVGSILDEAPYTISLMVKKECTEQDPAPFKWITLAKKSMRLMDAKDFLHRNWLTIIKKHDLYQLEG